MNMARIKRSKQEKSKNRNSNLEQSSIMEGGEGNKVKKIKKVTGKSPEKKEKSSTGDAIKASNMPSTVSSSKGIAVKKKASGKK